MRYYLSILALLFGSSHAQTQFENSEYSAGRFLGSVKASSAYNRGYTGAGSTILIIDTGINLHSPEFRNSIKGTIDYTRTGIQDKVGHGTNVASIAAANKDGVGMHGVAYDADLLIAKVTDNRSFSFPLALRAVQWGGSQGAIVANISANEVFNADYVRHIRSIAPGVFQNTHPIHGGKNYYNLIRPSDWAAALRDNNIVLVVSAGNAGRPYPDNPATLAAAADANGNLVLGGRMLVVGNFDQIRGSLHVTSNAAGTVCKDVVGNVCQDKYRISDFYIMAPGTAAVGAGTGTGYVALTGTSQAAPVVSGAVAVINQLWPNMRPENIVRLLLVTANKNIAGYNVNVHGQGLLDLEKATRPVGVVGIPVTGRIGTGATVVGGGALITSGSASLSRISSIMVVDSFDRDFYTNGQALTVAQPVVDFNANQTALPYRTHNSFSLYNNYVDVQTIENKNTMVRAYFDGRHANHMVEIGRTWSFDNVDLKLNGGGFQEIGTFLGTGMSGVFGYTRSSYTTFSNVSASVYLDDRNKVFGTFGYGITSLDYTGGLIQNINAVQSYTWNMGYEHQIDKKQRAGFMINQPVSILNATANALLPNGIDSNGYIQYNKQRFNLAPSIRELRMGAYYHYNIRSSNITGFIEHRQNYLGQSGVTNDVAGISINYSFK